MSDITLYKEQFDRWPSRSVVKTKKGPVTFGSIAKVGLGLSAIYYALYSLSSYDDNLSFTEKMDQYYKRPLTKYSSSTVSYEDTSYKSNWQRAKETFGSIISGIFAGADSILGTNSASILSPVVAGIVREDGKSVQVERAQLLSDDALSGLQTSRDLRARYGNNGGYNPNQQGAVPLSGKEGVVVTTNDPNELGRRKERDDNSMQDLLKRNDHVPGKTSIAGPGVLDKSSQRDPNKQNDSKQSNSNARVQIEKTNGNQSNNKSLTPEQVVKGGGTTADDLLKL